MTRKLKVDLDELERALEDMPSDLSYEITAVLDIEIGEVIFITPDDRYALNAVLEQIGDAEIDSPAFEEALQARVPEWERESVRKAARVEHDFGQRYIPIEADDPHADYGDMEAFVETVQDEQLQRRLDRGIRGRGAFRFFREELDDYPEERKRWFQFKSDRARERALEWLQLHDIEPILG
jgi:hypothetical protein